MAHFAVTAIGADRPGIVAAVTGALHEAGCNLEDSTMSILRGHFAILLVLDAPERETADALERTLDSVADDLDLVVTVRPIAERAADAPPGHIWTVAVYGADRPGIVHEITSLLAARNVNIRDVSTSVIGEVGSPVYAMLLDIDIPDDVDAAALSGELKLRADSIGVDVSMHEADADLL